MGQRTNIYLQRPAMAHVFELNVCVSDSFAGELSGRDLEAAAAFLGLLREQSCFDVETEGCVYRNCRCLKMSNQSLSFIFQRSRPIDATSNPHAS
jgi:hypothetical protein